MESHRKTLFRLKNTRLNRVLAHPYTGDMYVEDCQEAEEMLRACHGYLESMGAGSVRNEFIIEEVDAETLQQV